MDEEGNERGMYQNDVVVGSKKSGDVGWIVVEGPIGSSE